MTETLKAKIIQNEMIVDGCYYLNMELPFDYPVSSAGQFINIYLNNEAKILPRPISIFDHRDNELHLIYALAGNGTAELSKYKRNTYVRISTPLGNGFTIPEFIKDADDDVNDLLLIGGGMGIAPLHYLARMIYKKYRESSEKPYVNAVLGYNDEPFLVEFFRKYCDELQICSEKYHDDCWEGNVLIPLNECGYYSVKNWFSCGPVPMQKALTELAHFHDIMNFQVSLEERMGCGFGTCVGCTISTRNAYDDSIVRKKVCKDGPVFMGNEVIF